MPYHKKEWCPHPSHVGLTRSGSKSSRPVGRRIIDERDAKLFNTHIMLNSEWTSVTMKTAPEAKNPELRSINTQLKKDSAKEERNHIFQVLKVETIRDDRKIQQIRNQIDDIYRYLQDLCDVLEDNDPQLHLPNPHSLETNESNALLYGLKEPYQLSSEVEQTCLMTIGPLSWGKVMLSKWFGCTDNHEREALLRDEEKNVLAFPEYPGRTVPYSDPIGSHNIAKKIAHKICNNRRDFLVGFQCNSISRNPIGPTIGFVDLGYNSALFKLPPFPDPPVTNTVPFAKMNTV
ncbi:unnamed protein product [Adineta ricciae]|uniref:Uncharacterized protein n=1 Tax=Adineta ricciae TaxID=249248 RepID=A0A815W212_ADIRI|nr:unnamed protein product [Adineta ricciae]CAF1640884.1 unnamed protein product [Adineta ricciae]